MDIKSKANVTGNHFRLFDLPPELQNNIFEYTYQKPDDVGIVKRGSREHKRAAKRLELSEEANISMLAQYKVNEWLICKRWFVVAAKAYVCNSLIKLNMAGGFVTINARSTLHAFAKHLVTDSLGLCMLTNPSDSPRQISTLHLQVIPDDFYIDDNADEAESIDEVVFDDILDSALDNIPGLCSVLSDEEMRRTRVYAEAARLRGVQDFQVVTEYKCPYSNGSALMTNFDANMRLLHELLKPVVTRSLPKAGSQDSGLCKTPTMYLSVARLYPGSQVCAGFSVLADKAIDDLFFGALKKDQAATIGSAIGDMQCKQFVGTSEDAVKHEWSTPADKAKAGFLVEEARAEMLAMWRQDVEHVRRQYGGQYD